MNIFSIFLLAIGLSMDAFAVSICIGLTLPKITLRKALTVGLYFGVFQAGMPLIGYMTATLFADRVTDYAPWIAFGLLGFLGSKMIIGGFQKEDDENSEEAVPSSLSAKKMLPLAVATSIDALAVGVSLAFLEVNIVTAVLLIGIITLLLSMVGVKIGNIFGLKFKSRAEIVGGAILILIGVKILLEHLEIL
jgi:putative Mn2+ efflux pump MntP